VSAAPEEVIQSALEGLVPAQNIFGTRFDWNQDTGEIRSILRVPAGYGKVAVLDELQERLQISSDRIVYVGDGGSDVHVMLHVNHRDGFTIAASETRLVTPIARRTILADDALSVLVPVLEDIVGLDRAGVRGYFEFRGFVIREWDRMTTDRLSIESPGLPELPASA
ncbi:MAG TPA: haloacid dehalogenase-like hydrolase, partial [Thermoleophilia bacterium]|nr:haloacid dehalogenase-like hydrolase [Thermoleophilia bacterium]